MKKLWINVVPYKKDIAIAALESGAEAVVLAGRQKCDCSRFDNGL
jgi:coenzyme F420-reducing hydrogenase delta subunit